MNNRFYLNLLLMASVSMCGVLPVKATWWEEAKGRVSDWWEPETRAEQTAVYGAGRHGRITLRNLDLSRVPNELDLKYAGQLGSALSPLRSAEPSKIKDKVKRKRQEDDNLAFGRAMDKWNRHDYQEAVGFFKRHLAEYPDSPWRGESDLHLGCEAQFNGRWQEARSRFESILDYAKPGDEIWQKAKLRMSVLLMEQGQVKESKVSFAEMLQTETSWERTTYAQNWLRALSLYEGHMKQVRTCGIEAVAEIVRWQGNRKQARELVTKEAHGDYGFTLAELQEFAKTSGLKTAQAVSAQAEQLEQLPTPFIAHYGDEHFVAVKAVENGQVKVYDPRLKRIVTLNKNTFLQQWSGLALIVGAKPENVRLANHEELNKIGGCCGQPRPEELDCDDCDDDIKGCSSCRGMPEWSVNNITMDMVVQDVPLWYDNEIGPSVWIGMKYHSLDALNQLRPVGNKWTLNYASYAMESPGGDVTVIMPGGRRDVYQPASPSASTYLAPARRSAYKLVKTGTYSFELTLSDGTVYMYAVPPAMVGNGTSSLLVGIRDKNNKTLTVTHNANGKIIKLTDALGRETVFSYNAQGYVCRIDDPFGRHCTFSYDDEGNLTGQTDMGGQSYSYTYTKADVTELGGNFGGSIASGGRTLIQNNLFITAIIKPSGTTSFYTEPSDGINNGMDRYPEFGGVMWDNYRITITDPEGFKEEYYFYGYRQSSWYRDKNQYLSNQSVLSAPKTKYAFTLIDSKAVVSDVSLVRDGGSLVLKQDDDYTVGGQAKIQRDIRGNMTNYTYNEYGRTLTVKDVLNRTITYEYEANGLDVKKVIDSHNRVTAEYTYDSQRRVTSVKDMAGNITYTTYDANGKVYSTTDPLGNVTVSERNANGYVTAVKRNGVTVQSYMRDALGRVLLSTDADGVTLGYEYDNLNRVTRVIHGDGTSEVNVYTCCGLASYTDREGRTTHYTYDGNLRLTLMQDAAGRIFHYDYDPAGNLIKLTDAAGNETEWLYDDMNRVTKKVYLDGGAVSYEYDSKGDMTEKTNARGQKITYTYSSTTGSLLTEKLSGTTVLTNTYDADGQLVKMVDLTGTTTYAYDVQDRLQSVSGPWANSTVQYVYDNYSRLTNKIIGSATQGFVYDNLGRLNSESNPLGTFEYVYETASNGRITQMNYPNGMTLKLSYLPASQEKRLGEIRYEDANHQLISRHAYSYSPAGNIQSWTQQSGTATPKVYQFGYDPVDQLVTALQTQNNSTVSDYAYRYDLAGNRTQEQINGNTKQAIYNNLNQLISTNSGGKMRFAGQTNKETWVTVSGQAAKKLPDNKFEAWVEVQQGLNNIQIVAMDASKNKRTNTYQVIVPATTPQMLRYDVDGNLLEDGNRKFTWNAKNQLTKIQYLDGSGLTEFTYDGLGRRTKIIEKNNAGIAQSENRYLWVDGNQPAEERDANNNVIKRYYGQGEQVLSATSPNDKLYYTKDHLGSIRELINASTQIQARYDYDPYGRRTKLSGNLDTIIAYTGHHLHIRSNLYLTWYRQYDPQLGRWLSRDPIEEQGGINLYGYVKGNIIAYKDMLGLAKCSAKEDIGNINFTRIEIIVGMPGDTPTATQVREALKNIETKNLGTIASITEAAVIGAWNLWAHPGQFGAYWIIEYQCCVCNKGKIKWSSAQMIWDRVEDKDGFFYYFANDEKSMKNFIKESDGVRKKLIDMAKADCKGK